MNTQPKTHPPPPQQPPSPPPHVLLLPLPLQGPINCYLQLAHILSLSSDDVVHVTFLNSASIHRRLPDLPSRFRRHKNFHYTVVADGTAGDGNRDAGDTFPMVGFPVTVSAIEADVIRRLPELTVMSPAVTCLVADGVYTAVGVAAMEVGIPVVYFTTLSPCCIWINSCLVPSLVDNGKVPFKQGDDLDEPVIDIPGTETSVRRRDLPCFCRNQDVTDPYRQLILRECRELPNAQGHILNSFDALEGPVLDHLRSVCPNLYTIGPLHLHWKTRMQLKLEEQATSSNSLWKEDRGCLAWLDKQPSKSVVYVSVGSIVVMKVEQVMELWYGLVNSGFRFLWVRRPGSTLGLEQFEVPEEVLKGTKDRGFLVSWAPQQEVLAHRAIGGFLTHSGWNSTLESVLTGVPMLCWPVGIDQMVISRFVSDVWKIGTDMKDSCDRVVIENEVRDLMTRRKDEFAQKVNQLSEYAKQAVEEGGSSWCSLDRLIDDIKLMRLKV